MNYKLLDPEVQSFIRSKKSKDMERIAFRLPNFNDCLPREILEQIESRLRCEDKLPTWFQTEGIYYPPKISVEQSSSELTAAYKSTLIEGETLVDMTGGMGVDDYYFSKVFARVIHCELNPELSRIVKHNFKILGIKNIECLASDSMDYLKTSKVKADWIYIDPSRRHDIKGKVFMLKDCLPNVPAHLEQLWEHTAGLLIKTSPLLDLQMGLSELIHVERIHVIALQNEVKELLWVLRPGHKSSTTEIQCTNIHNETLEQFSFIKDENTEIPVSYSMPSTFLYEPNAAIMKSGGFKETAAAFKLNKLHLHSHLYTSDQKIAFPGRVFKVQEVIPFSRKEVAKRWQGKKALITTRNFPVTVEELRKRFKIKDGGETTLFFTTGPDGEKLMLECQKIS